MVPICKSNSNLNSSQDTVMLLKVLSEYLHSDAVNSIKLTFRLLFKLGNKLFAILKGWFGHWYCSAD